PRGRKAAGQIGLDRLQPWFGNAPDALLQRLAALLGGQRQRVGVVDLLLPFAQVIEQPQGPQAANPNANGQNHPSPDDARDANVTVLVGHVRVLRLGQIVARVRFHVRPGVVRRRGLVTHGPAPPPGWDRTAAPAAAASTARPKPKRTTRPGRSTPPRPPARTNTPPRAVK